MKAKLDSRFYSHNALLVRGHLGTSPQVASSSDIEYEVCDSICYYSKSEYEHDTSFQSVVSLGDDVIDSILSHLKVMCQPKHMRVIDEEERKLVIKKLNHNGEFKVEGKQIKRRRRPLNIIN